ncbi:hypothetical protein [Halobacterium yunchengense]|uniref:COG4315 family predicted lipoprotein n=1 Tax=Halobacterium yunchengense TaxID=3108497 RepID=UPI0030084305
MHRRRYLAALSAGAAAALAGCTSGDGGGAATTEEPTTAPPTATPAATTTAAETTAEGGDATVLARSVGEFGDVLVDADGFALYLFDPDERGESTCYDDCASNWPPLTVDADPTAGSGVTADLGTAERDDGSLQVTASDWPLYYFAGDEAPGDANGQGLNDVWWLVGPDGSRVTGAASEATTTAEPTTTSDDSTY